MFCVSEKFHIFITGHIYLDEWRTKGYIMKTDIVNI